jgi:glucoamylase
MTLTGGHSLPVFGWPWWPQNNKIDGVQQTFSSSQQGTLLAFQEFENWLDSQSSFAFESLIHNIGGYGPDLEDGVLKGMPIASPSKIDPDYYYYWVRDSAITANTLVLSFADQYNSTIRDILLNYIESCFLIQRIDNPSGTFENLNGLGEPKFLVNGSAFNRVWGRPQRDGPALRAMSIMNIIIAELRHNRSASYRDFEDTYYRVVKPDLEYTAQKWHLPGFDLWEEISGLHFFTLMVQQKALSLGAHFALTFGDTDACNDYTIGSETIQAFLTENFWSEGHNYLIETLHPQRYGRSGLDSAVLLAALQVLLRDVNESYDVEFTSDSKARYEHLLFEPYSEEMIATLQMLIYDMETRYPINLRRLNEFKNAPQEYKNKVGVGIGRYPEDIYDGLGQSLGNPWFITTAAVAQSVYSIAGYLESQDEWFVLNTTDRPLLAPFFNQFVNETDFALSRLDSEYDALVRNLIVYGDSFMDVVREHVSNEGDMSEQFSRYDGYMKGAERLTWSYGSLWTASRERRLLKTRLV